MDNDKNKLWGWLDDTEYLIRISLPVFLIICGIFGPFMGLKETLQNQLLMSGLTGAGLTSRKR